MKLTGSVPDPAGPAQSNPVLGFSGGVLQSSDVVDESFVNVGDEQRRQLGVERPTELGGSEPAGTRRPTHDEALAIVCQPDHVGAQARRAAVAASNTCLSRAPANQHY